MVEELSQLEFRQEGPYPCEERAEAGSRRLACRLQNDRLNSFRNEKARDSLQLIDQIGDRSEMTDSFG